MQYVLEPFGLYNPMRDTFNKVHKYKNQNHPGQREYTSKRRYKHFGQFGAHHYMLQRWMWSSLFNTEGEDHTAKAYGEDRADGGAPVLKRPRRRRSTKKFKKRNRPAYYTCQFIQDLENPFCQDPKHIDGREFRLNYRMPWQQVQNLITTFENHPEWLPTRRMRANGRGRCPLSILIMGVLYWCGEGCTWRNVENVAGRVVSYETFRQFSRHFFAAVAKHIAPLHIKLPQTVEDCEKLHKEYAARGHPGAIGSVDGVQLCWEGCPYAWRRYCTGKEKYPTLGFNVTCDLDGRIQHTTPVMAGRFNDLTKARFDSYIQLLRSGVFDDFVYELYKEDGTKIVKHGPYLICDNGYHAWLQLMCGAKHTARTGLTMWSVRLEETRKDIERVFGMLKKRFRALKVPILIQDAAVVNNLWITCCTFHNICLDCDTQFRKDEGHFRMTADQARHVVLHRLKVRLLAHSDWSYLGYEFKRADPEFVRQRDPDFEKFRWELARHYTHEWGAGRIQCGPRRRGAK